MSIEPLSRFVRLRNAFFTGLLLLAPLVVTIWAFGKIIDLVGSRFRPIFFFFLPDWLTSRPSLYIILDVLSTLLVILLITLLGYVSRYVFGKYLLSVTERFMQSIPGVSTIYNTVKQLVDTFSVQKRNLFNKVVLLEFPRQGCWVIGFLTNMAQGEAQAKTSEEIWTVFVPTTPNPTSGFLVMLPRRDITELDMSIGDGMKMIISGGTITPPWPAVQASKLQE